MVVASNNLSKPKLFISHKHVDRPIAEQIANFLKEKSGFSIDIHFSSSPQFKGPRIGRNLTDELRSALARTDALILVYTKADQDWSYCMWECGVATDPASSETNIYVFQCGNEVPTPFVDKVRVDASKLDDLRSFVSSFLVEEDFFPGRGQAVNANVPENAIDQYAKDLFEKIEPFVTQLRQNKPDNQWQTWPYLEVEFSSKSIDDAVKKFKSGQEIEAQDALIETGLITFCHARLPQLFGKTAFPETLKLKDIAEISYHQDSRWVKSCAAQIIQGSQMEFVVAEWDTLKDKTSKSEFIPVLCEVRQNFSAGVMAFKIYFIDVMNPRAIPAKTRMIRFGDFSFKNFESEEVRMIPLQKLREDMQSEARLRLPLLDANNRVRYIVHKSLIDDFLLRSLTQGAELSSANIKNINLGQLLADPHCAKIAQDTFAVIGENVTVSVAQRIMNSVPGCRDVFVTEGGSKDGKVVGWLTNVALGI